MDREKVINGLKCHAEHNCDGCPYYGKNQFDVSLCPKIITDAIELLKEQQEQIDKLIEESASNAEMAEGMRELLKEQPQIVRCKDCNKFIPPHGCMHIENYIDADWFCADGERRTE